MKEIKILIRDLNKYPNNLFAYPTNAAPKGKPPMRGLEICNVKGEVQGFIELGINNGQVVL